MKVFFNTSMSTDSFGYSPSAAKPAMVVADWFDQGLEIEIVDFVPATESDLCLAHDPDYVRGVLSGKIDNGHGNNIKSVTEPCLWTVGSLVAASRAALTDSITCSPTSGFHHAGYGHGGGFCTFNGLVIAARTLIDDGTVSRVGIVDFDYHYGDGTHDILRNRKMTDIAHWTFGEFRFDKGFNVAKVCDALKRQLKAMADSGVKLVLYQAGADPHEDDPLGGCMTDQQLARRDKVVFETCHKLKMSVCWNLAGGYQREKDGSIPKVLEIHRNTTIEAIRVLHNPPNAHDLSLA